MRMGFDISLNNFDRELYTTFKLVIEQRENESSEHILLKVLAACLFWQPGIEIEPPEVDPTYRPDVLLRGDDGGPKIWIECGQVRTVKLDKLVSRYPQLQLVVVKRIQREVDDLFERCVKDVRRPYNLEYRAFGPHFIDRLATSVMGKNECTVLVSGGNLQVILNGADHSCQVYQRQHEGPGYRGKSYV